MTCSTCPSCDQIAASYKKQIPSIVNSALENLLIALPGTCVDKSKYAEVLAHTKYCLSGVARKVVLKAFIPFACNFQDPNTFLSLLINQVRSHILTTFVGNILIEKKIVTNVQDRLSISASLQSSWVNSHTSFFKNACA